MAESLQSQVEKLRLSINGLEAQRGILGDEIVNPALATLRDKLKELEQQAAVESQALVEERRMVTILFMDMVGSTGIAEKLDPEEWRQVVKQLHATLGEAVVTHHGEVAQYLGDGLLAFFGARKAGEHDPENAVLAALEAHTAVANQHWTEKVQVRAGIHTGLVVVGELGQATHTEFTASGDAMNLAARMQSAAPPGGILISHDTYRYVRGVFDLTPRPPLAVKGKSEPLHTYLVRRAKMRPFRSVARGVAGIETRTVGREAEMQALQHGYLQAYERHGTVWTQLTGEPGVGKSRLLEDMSDWMELREETTRLLRARAFPDDANQPYALVRRMWFDRFQIAEDAPLEQAEAKWVERFTEFAGQDASEEAAHALGLLVGLPFEDSPHIMGMRSDPTQVKGRALVVSRELVWAARRQMPVVVLLEDLQWADAASWEYLVEVFLRDETGERQNGVFILGTARPEWRLPDELAALFESSVKENQGPEKPETTASGALLTLQPLSDLAARELVKELLQRAVDVPEQVIDLLIERSEGVPYFIEEIVNWFVDRGILDTRTEQWRFLPERLKEQPLPATLQHLLLTRLSSLSQPERAALQRGAIFGRRFWTGGVDALGLSSSGETLGHLQPRGFVEVQPESSFEGDTEWSFHHNLLQEVTYESVLKRERAALHKVAAGWLERQARQAGRLDEFAGLLGDHYERAGEQSAAADWYLRAGKRAMSQGAPREAANFYTQALELLPPVDRERRWQALLGRDEAHRVMGDTEPRRSDLTELLELARAIGDDQSLAEAYLRQVVLINTTGDVHTSYQAAQEAVAAARRCGSEGTEAKALSMIAVLEINRGNQTAAIENIEAALRLARSVGDESVLALVLFGAAYCYSQSGNFGRCHQLQNEQIELDHRLGNRSQEAVGLNNLGNNLAFVGQYKQARAVLEQGSQISKALGARSALAYHLLTLGNLYLNTGDLRKARQVIEEGLQQMSFTQDARGKLFGLIDLGLVLLAMGDIPGAARRFSEAREFASSLSMAPFVCNSASGLAACALLQGELDEAGQYAGEAWDYLKDHGWVGVYNPIGVYRTCAETFDALGDMEKARQVIQSAHQVLMETADKIDVPAWRQSYLENVPDNRAMMEMWARS